MGANMQSAIWLANPRGFCAGVDRAIEIVELLLARHGPPIYVKHEIVHNKRVISELSAKGAIFIEDPTLVPHNSVLVFSAHGVSQKVRIAAAKQGLRVHDATCPLVSKVHAQVVRMHSAGQEIFMIGHAGHPEVEGTMGQIASGIHLIETEQHARQVQPVNKTKLAYVTQTTLSVDETRAIIDILIKRFPMIKAPAREDICYATQNRQDAVKVLARKCDMVFVVGSANSSNSNRLCEVVERLGVVAKLIDGAADICVDRNLAHRRIGVTAGASAPEKIVQEVVTRLREIWPEAKITELAGVSENVHFAVPKNLLSAS